MPDSEGKDIKVDGEEIMDVKKYRLYLLMITVAVVLIGALSYLYFSDRDKTYQEGTLVQNEFVIEEELA